ncbi:MAG: helix-turn-helix transcriptional regulator [Natronospirillum sp.]|uniref:helix-turn-helix transcriptional regulator n=1 Tax=Natronospirillum sp. TaxID=2812955 RepID=UPI0025EF8312|nr:substrate-binding domain-containing protein [Natronospirillum sp.]MCH8533117.1 helix-turn-helix transcriptional regulator [Saccharospirillum sp.]MCH8553403.1 helix-turn-helix transcriptional regulator [Natronospirillum sp.]
MRKLTIQPAWLFHADEQHSFDRTMFTLLRGIHSTGKLTEAAREAHISYRHAWNLLNRWEAFFGLPLVSMRKGQGTRLSALGETLLWAEQRLQARLGPQTESMASELNMELQQLLEGAHPVLRVHASHGYAVALLPTFRDQLELNLQYCSPTDALTALNRGDCDIAGFHLPTDQSFGQHIFNTYKHLLDADQHCVIRFITRQQGLMMRDQMDPPISSLTDLTRPALRFINRQKDSGTRALLNLLLKKANIDGQDIQGFEREEYTHTAIAAYIASNMADAGFGVEAAARQFGLGFLPLAKEHYLMICRKDRLSDEKLQRFLGLLKSPAFIEAVNALPGYQPNRCGEVEALPF